MFAILEKAKPNTGSIKTKFDSSSTWDPWKDPAGIIARANLVAWSAVQGMEWQRPCIYCKFK